MKRMWSKNELNKITALLLASGTLASISADEINAGEIHGDEIIENMSGYSASMREITGITLENVYCGIVKNGNKLTIVHAFNITRTDNDAESGWFAYYYLPSAIMSKLYPTQIGTYDWLSVQEAHAFSNELSSVKVNIGLLKSTDNLTCFITTDNLVLNTKYYVRIEYTFLLSDNLISQE